MITATKKNVTVDATPTANSTNPVQSGGVKAALDRKQGTLTFDNAPTAGSDNPVKSGGVKEALDSKKNVQAAVSSPAASGNALAFIDTISQNEQGVITATKKSVTVDATPTANSTNPVKSGGVKAALNGKQDKLTLPLAISQGGTGANTIDGAKSALNIGKPFDLTYGEGSSVEEINGNVDLNDYVTPGNYRISSANKAATISNIPYKNGNSRLIVFVNSMGGTVIYGMQLLIAPNDNKIYTRAAIMSGGNQIFSGWRELSSVPITANMGTVTGTGSTVTVTKIVTGVTSNMTVDRIEFGTPSAVQSGWTVTTTTNSVTFSAKISGSTTVKVKLSDNIDVTGT